MTKITVRDDGSYLVKGDDFQIVDAEGNVYETKSAVSLCRCGLSENKPFCDGSHKGKFKDQSRAK